MWSIFTSKIIVVFVTLIIVGVDIFLATDNIRGNTWSEVIRNWGRHILVIPYMFGVLGGHFFGLNSEQILPQPNAAILLAWSAWVVIIVSLGVRGSGIVIHPMLLVMAGTISGYFLWSN